MSQNIFKSILPDIITYLQVTASRPILVGGNCYVSRWHIDVGQNVGFKHMVNVIVVDGYAATNLLWPWTTFQSCAVISVISLANVNQI